MKVLLLDLGDNRKENNEPISLGCLAANINNANVIVDIEWYNMEYNVANVINYDIIGISMNIGTLPVFDKIYSHFLPQQIIIVGGTIPTFGYSQLLDKYENIYCCIGEGEETFSQLLDVVITDKTLRTKDNIPNIAYKTNGKLHITDRKPFNINLANKVFRKKEIIDFIKETNGIVRIEASRGCSWRKCTFCCVNSKYADPKWRPFPIDKITNELIELSDMGVTSPYFTDEDFFGGNPNRVKELAESILELKNKKLINPQMDFFISAMANDITCKKGEEAIIAFKKAGLREVFIGIESMEKGQLKRYNKLAKTDQNAKVIKFLKNNELQIDMGFILFDPNLAFQGLINSIEYIDNLSLSKTDSRSIKRLRIQPCTKMGDDFNISSDKDLDLNNLEYPYEFTDQKVSEVYKKYKKWEEEYMNKIWKYQALTRGENVSNRLSLKRQLGAIRDIDFIELKNITELIRGNICQNEYDSREAQLRKDKKSAMDIFEDMLRKS